jgi:hypothetical protein
MKFISLNFMKNYRINFTRAMGEGAGAAFIYASAGVAANTLWRGKPGARVFG